MDRHQQQMDRYLCLHLHFYQPPRENPWLAEIEYQESAYPFHDWNERINIECYRANGASRIMDAEGRVVQLANNYAKVSFNFGPTLLSWLEHKDPDTYERILEGDRISRQSFGGHGSAIAQAYNHVIMPLANRRDKETQILWGLRDFETRFQRAPEAMWLPETAVDTETLEMLSYHGMKYVILAPRQAKAVRSLERDEPWHDVSGERVDPKKPYWVRLPSGRRIVAFFYDGPISKAVAFEGLLHNGEVFANRLLQGYSSSGFSPEFSPGSPQGVAIGRGGSPQLLHIATDGETYGHHHRYGEMALAYAIWHLERNNLATITNYGQFLEMVPPVDEAQIHAGSSWSCAHGIERWRADCGCNSGMRGDWRQRWRGPVRAAMDHVRDQMEEPFESTMKRFSDDPWGARDAYIDVIKDRTLASIEAFLVKWCRGRELSDEEKTTVLKALEAQHNLLLMYTSCGWFFDEVSGIETIQNLQYALRAIELGEAAFGLALLDGFMARLEKAESNIPEIGNGRVAFQKYVIPARVDTLRVGAHFAVASIFEAFGEKNEVYNNKITLIDFNRFESGRARLACGQARIRSRATLERHRMTFGVIHLGDHNVSAGVRFFENDDRYNSLLQEARSAFDRADFPNVIRVLDRYFGSSQYSLKDLFKDEQRKFVDVIMSETMQETEERFGRLYQTNYPLVTYLSDLHVQLPKVIGHIAEFVQNRGIRRTLFSANRVRTDVVRKYLAEAASLGVRLDESGLVRDFEMITEKKMIDFADDESLERLEELIDLVRLGSELPFKTNLGFVQNRFFIWYESLDERQTEFIGASAKEAPRVREMVGRLAQLLRVKLPDRTATARGGGMQGAERDVSGDVPPAIAEVLSPS